MYDICFCYTEDPQLVKHWDFVLSHWKPRDIYCIAPADAKPFDSNPLKRVKFIRDTGDLPEIPLILMAPKAGVNHKGTRSLKTFHHPMYCVYLFGSDHSHIGEEITREPSSTVYIPTDDNVEMYSHVAAAVTLYDRKVKRGA